MNRSYLLAANLPIISATLCLTFYCLWRQQKRPHVLNWSLSYFFGLLGSSIGMARIVVEESALYSFMGNGFLVGMAFFAARGVIIRHTGQTADHLLVPIYAVTLIGGLWFGFVEPSVFARGTAASAGAAAMFLIAARTLLKTTFADTVDYLTAAAFVVTAAMLVGRPLLIHAFDSPVEADAEVTGSWWGVSFRMLAMLSWLSIAILFVLRTTTDLMKDLAAQSRTDSLTGISNRRGFFSAAKTSGKGDTFAVLICDLDDFKKVNDTYGHKVGDTVIRNFAQVLRLAAEGAGCMIGRLGGEEFVGLLPRANVVHARAFAETVRTTFAATAHRGVPPSHIVTVSIGVAVAFGDRTLEPVLDQADAALYRAKLNGKNCVEVAALPLQSPPERPSQIGRPRERQAQMADRAT